MEPFGDLVHIVRQVLQQSDCFPDLRKIQLQHIAVQDHHPEEGGFVFDRSLEPAFKSH